MTKQLTRAACLELLDDGMIDGSHIPTSWTARCCVLHCSYLRHHCGSFCCLQADHQYAQTGKDGGIWGKIADLMVSQLG